MAATGRRTPGMTIQTGTGQDETIPMKSPRIARFAEATAVDSPIEAPADAPRFAEQPYTPVESVQPQLQAGDVGFGYVNDRRSMHDVPHVEMPAEPPLSPGGPKSPLKSAMKTPGAKPRKIEIPKSPMFQEESILSPTWREEKLVEKRETRTSRMQKDDLAHKVRVRMAKLVLRFTNFSCSLIVLTMLGTVITVFNASVNLETRNNLPPWAPNTPQWPQITVLCIACVSLAASIGIIIAYCRKGHKRAEKWAAYYSIMAIGFFVVSIIMWATGAGIFQHQKNQGDGQDMWGWSCKTNLREKAFPEVNYSLVCRLQNWSLVCCIIEVVVEVITILIYAIVFYRYWSKRKLTKSMDKRDKARSELYMSQALKSPGGTNPYFPSSPGVGGPATPREGGYNPMYSPRFAPNDNSAEKGMGDPNAQFTSLAGALAPPPEKKFTLSKPPTKSPKSAQGPTFSQASVPSSPVAENVNQHVSAAPGEQQYGEVPIPGAYS